MRIRKVFEAKRFFDTDSYPSDKQFADVIVKFGNKFPSSPILHNIARIFEIPFDSIGNYDIVYDRLVNPVKAYGSGLRKTEFIDNNYKRMYMYIHPDIDILDDIFFDIWDGSVVGVSPRLGSYFVSISRVKKADIPDLYKRLINVIDPRIPKNYRMSDIIYV